MSRRLHVSKALASATILVSFLAIITAVIVIVTFQMQMTKLAGTVPSASPPEPLPSARLPGNLRPERYKIYVQTHLYTKANITNHTSTFNGNSTVKFRCVEATRWVIIHCKELNVTAIHLMDRHGSPIVLEDAKLNNETEFLEIELADALRVDTIYYLFIAFGGILDYSLEGFYMNQYTEDKGSQRFLATSQLQATHARKVFPCFDEPAMKAVFMVTLIHRPGTVALSNAAQKEQKMMNINGEDWLITEFHPTVKMSTYLVALTVCEYTCQTTNYGRYVIKTWARPDAVAAGHVDYAQSITGPILQFFEDLYDIKYPLSKLDQIAVPDFLPDGMENWGLVVYREKSLLHDEGVSLMTDKGTIARLIAHELAHQWFGNLVTMRWWNDAWLNEGFSTYLSYFGVDSAEPTWNYKDLFFLNELRVIWQIEFLENNKVLVPKEDEVLTPSDIDKMFNLITYIKGAMVLRMLASYVSEPVFNSGVKSYLQTHLYNTAECQDLWRHIQRAVDGNNDTAKVADMMKFWTEEPGYPLVTINTSSGAVWQEHFIINETLQSNVTWQVPIKLLRSDSLTPAVDLLTVKGPVSKPVYQSKNNEWILANINCTGYYRVNYDPENWERLLQQLEVNHHMIPVLNRAQLIDDAFQLAKANFLDITLALRTTKYLHKEKEYVSWETALNNLHDLIHIVDRSDSDGPIKAYLRKIVAPLYDHFEAFTVNLSMPECITEQYNLVNAINTACSSGLRKCQKMATDTFNQWKRNPSSKRVHLNLRSSIYCAAIAAGGPQEWEVVWQMFQNSTVDSEKELLRGALSCSKDVGTLKRFLEYSLDPDKRTDFISTVLSISGSVTGQSAAWDFIRSQWTNLKEKYGNDGMLGSVIEEVTEKFSSEREFQELRQFLEDHAEEEDFGPTESITEYIIDRMEATTEWVEKNKQIVLEWFHRESVAY